MMEAHRMASHPDDGELVRFLDQQMSPNERRGIFAHLAGCGACSARMEALREQSQAASRLIGSLDAASPDQLTRARALAAARRAQSNRSAGRHWHSAGGLRAAAVVALAALATLGVEPVRAWVADRWTDLVGGDAPAPVIAVQPTPVLERGSVISFAPAGETFVLEIENRQQVGSVTLELADVGEASAQVVNGRSEEIVVLPAGVRVANSSASSASYRFTLPRELRLIQVFAGGRPVAIIPLDDPQLPWSRTVSLHPAPQSR